MTIEIIILILLVYSIFMDVWTNVRQQIVIKKVREENNLLCKEKFELQDKILKLQKAWLNLHEELHPVIKVAMPPTPPDKPQIVSVDPYRNAKGQFLPGNKAQSYRHSSHNKRKVEC